MKRLFLVIALLSLSGCYMLRKANQDMELSSGGKAGISLGIIAAAAGSGMSIGNYVHPVEGLGISGLVFLGTGIILEGITLAIALSETRDACTDENFSACIGECTERGKVEAGNAKRNRQADYRYLFSSNVYYSSGVFDIDACMSACKKNFLCH